MNESLIPAAMLQIPADYDFVAPSFPTLYDMQFPHLEARVPAYPLENDGGHSFREWCTATYLNTALPAFYTKIADKLFSKLHVQRHYPEIPVARVYFASSRAQKIPVDELRQEMQRLGKDRYLLKVNHAAGVQALVRLHPQLQQVFKFYHLRNMEVADVSAAKDVLSESVLGKYGLATGEYWYVWILAKIFAEEYLHCKTCPGSHPPDLKLHVIDGHVRAAQLMVRRFDRKHARGDSSTSAGVAAPGSAGMHGRAFVDWRRWRHLRQPVDLAYGVMRPSDFRNLRRPGNLEAAVAMAEHFSATWRIPYVRVDFFLVDGVLHFAEFAISPDGCRVNYSIDLFEYSQWAHNPGRI